MPIHYAIAKDFLLFQPTAYASTLWRFNHPISFVGAAQVPLLFLQQYRQMWCLRVPSIGVADRLADSNGQQCLVAGVSQGVDGLREHAS